MRLYDGSGGGGGGGGCICINEPTMSTPFHQKLGPLSLCDTYQQVCCHAPTN